MIVTFEVSCHQLILSNNIFRFGSAGFGLQARKICTLLDG